MKKSKDVFFIKKSDISMHRDAWFEKQNIKINKHVYTRWFYIFRFVFICFNLFLISFRSFVSKSLLWTDMCKSWSNDIIIIYHLFLIYFISIPVCQYIHHVLLSSFRTIGWIVWWIHWYLCCIFPIRLQIFLIFRFDIYLT